MLDRRTLLAAPMVVTATPLRAATVADVLVIAKRIDDTTSLDPHESFEASGGNLVIDHPAISPYVEVAQAEEANLAKRVSG